MKHKAKIVKNVSDVIELLLMMIVGINIYNEQVTIALIFSLVLVSTIYTSHLLIKIINYKKPQTILHLPEDLN